ncbi:hypothetical protein MCOR25_005336 [Pyricularia grisea]|nr:hypothetical protein MCOR25_005336 [Pyricularia grisea]
MVVWETSRSTAKRVSKSCYLNRKVETIYQLPSLTYPDDLRMILSSQGSLVAFAQYKTAQPTPWLRQARLRSLTGPQRKIGSSIIPSTFDATLALSWTANSPIRMGF